MIDTKKLREFAEAATPGPWRHNPAPTHHEPVWRVEHTARGANRGAQFVVANVDGTEKNDVANAAFIAAANPQTVLNLMDEIERLRALVGEK